MKPTLFLKSSSSDRIYASLESLRNAIDDLKGQSETSFSVTSDVRTSLADVQELRATISETIKSL